MSFYGYDPGQYVKNFDWLRDLGKDVASIPVAVQAQQEINEGKIQNEDIYSGVTQIAGKLSDEEFESSYGMNKDTFLKMAKPGKSEKPEMYFPRIFKMTEKGNAVISAKKGYQSFIDELSTPTPEMEEAKGFIGEGGTPEEYQSIMGKGVPTAPSRTPQDIMSIGQKHGMSTEQVTPEVQKATAAQTSEQLGKINSDMTRVEGYKAIGGDVTPVAEKAIGTLMSEKDIITNKRLTEASNAKALSDIEKIKIAKWKAANQQRKLTNDERREIKDSKIRAMSIRDKLLVNIKSIEAGLTKSNKDVIGGIDQESLKKDIDALESLRISLDNWDDDILEYDLLIKEKGGITPQTKPVSKPTKRKPLSAVEK